MSVSRATLQRRENDRIDMIAEWRVVVEFELENLTQPRDRETYVWHRINDAANGKRWGDK